MSRMIFGVALGFALAVAAGCGSTPGPTPAPAAEAEPKKESEAATTAEPPKVEPPKVEPPKVEPPKVAWEMDADKHVVPAAAVRGRIAGVDAAPEASVAGDELAFRVTKAGEAVPERSVAVRFAPGQPALGRNWKVTASDAPGPNVPEVWLEVKNQPIHLHPSGYAMTLELGARKDGKVAGKIVLSLPDKDQTVLAGTFSADYFRPHTEKPGPDDAPYVTGEVSVVGADPKAEVRVAYAAFLPGGGVTFKELQLAPDPLPVDQARWTSDDEKPRSSTLLPGDGKARPFRYEHTRLKPGRYLFSAAVAGGPAVWKWLDVPAAGTAAENFALDVSKTGGLEVTAAPGVTGKVFLAPADDPGRPPLDEKLFEGISIQVVRTDVEVVGGKAIVKNLGTGRYEVRLGDERRTVDVVPGKTAEVNLTPPKK